MRKIFKKRMFQRFRQVKSPRRIVLQHLKHIILNLIFLLYFFIIFFYFQTCAIRSKNLRCSGSSFRRQYLISGLQLSRTYFPSVEWESQSNFPFRKYLFFLVFWRKVLWKARFDFFVRISTSCISRLASSLFWYFQDTF